MSWFLWAIATAFFASTRDYLAKRHITTIEPLVVSWALSLFSVPLLAVFLAFAGIPEIEKDFQWSLPLASILLTAAWVLYVRALSLSEMSITIPMIALSPVFLLVLAPIFLGEIPSLIGVFGVLLIVSGGYVLGISESAFGLLGPFRALVTEGGPRVMLVCACILSCVAIIEKIGIRSSSPILFPLAECALTSLLMIPIIYYRSPTGFSQVVTHWKILFAIGSAVALMFACQATAMNLGPVTYVVALKRLSILFSVLAGGLLLSESAFWSRMTGTVVILIGVICVSFG